MNRNQNPIQFGFTVTELLVVVVIMVLMATVVVVGWNNQRPNRSLRIAQNETVTQIRKAQSYAVTSRNISAAVSASYYTVRFEVGQTSYSINALGAASDDYNYASDLETIRLPDGVSISELTLYNSLGVASSVDCVQIIISAVYGKMYFHNSLSCGSDVVDIVKHPPTMAALPSGNLEIEIVHEQSGSSRTIILNGFSNKVETNIP